MIMRVFFYFIFFLLAQARHTISNPPEKRQVNGVLNTVMVGRRRLLPKELARHSKGQWCVKKGEGRLCPT